MLSLLLLFACETSTTTTAPVCTLGVPTLSVSTASPGDQVVATATRLTEAYDTAITVGTVRATVVDLDRSTCDDCDTCQDTGGCTACSDCTECEATCQTCVETVTFTVPELAPGDYPVEIVNRHGRSETVTLTVASAFPAP